MSEPIACSPKLLNEECHDDAALAAIEENPLNAPHVHGLVHLLPDAGRASIAMMTSKYWRTDGVRLTVGFLDNPPKDLRTRILAHMNAWAESGNILFTETDTDPQVRIARDQQGYWSYIGTDILLIDRDKPTMNLQGFTSITPESEFRRVVRHETGHTLGCPHEHMRGELIAMIDPDKAIAYYGATQGWTPQQVRAQVLTPIEERSILGTPTDQQSIMCYHIPGQLTRDGKAITGGTDIDPSDYDFIGRIYPKPTAAAPASTPALMAAGGARALRAPIDHHRCSIQIDTPGGTPLLLQRDLSANQIGRLAKLLAG